MGFEPETRTDGFGLAGMQERVYLAGGSLQVNSGETGTLVQATLPQRSEERVSPSRALV